MTPTPGTTRDVIELSLNFHGFPIIVADTAGLRSTTEEVEAIGVERALHRYAFTIFSPYFYATTDCFEERAQTADIKLCVLSLPEVFGSTEATKNTTAYIDPLTLSLIDESTIILLNKIDGFSLTASHFRALSDALRERAPSIEFWPISVKEELGLREFVERLKELLKIRLDCSLSSQLTLGS